MINYKLIWEQRNSLDKDSCDAIIQDFEKDPDKKPSIIGFSDTDLIKKTIGLSISSLESWKKLDAYIFDSVNKSVDSYKLRLNKINNNLFLPLYPMYDINDGGYFIEKYDVKKEDNTEGFFKLHNDFLANELGTRLLTFVIFLNDVHEGGQTEFIDGTKIKPEVGKIVIFPSNWDMIYKYVAPISNDKYICTGFFYIKIKDTEENESKD